MILHHVELALRQVLRQMVAVVGNASKCHNVRCHVVDDAVISTDIIAIISRSQNRLQ